MSFILHYKKLVIAFLITRHQFLGILYRYLCGQIGFAFYSLVLISESF
jgi:hypothetical protein